MKSSQVSEVEIVEQLNAWPVAFCMGIMVLVIILMQSVWNTIEGLYFSHAYEATVFPFMMYIVWQIFMYGQGEAVNTNKISILALLFSALFLPALFLVGTNQIDIHGMIFSDYSPELEHMPAAKYLPFVFLTGLLVPIKTRAAKASTN